jgi:hypothetical protein
MQQHIDTPTIEAMLGPLTSSKLCFKKLCQLPAAAQLSSSAVAALLLQAMKHSAPAEAVNQLCRLPAAEQLTKQHAAKVLEKCIATNLYTLRNNSADIDVYSYIGQIPAVAQLSAPVLVRLLHTAVKRRSMSDVNRLCAMPAAAHINRQELLPLLLAALTALKEGAINFVVVNACRSNIVLLMQLPAVSQLSSADVSQWMCEIAEHRLECVASDLYMPRLFNLPAAKQLSKDQVLVPLRALAQSGSIAGMAELTQLPAAQHISRWELAQLLQAAVKSSSPGCAAALCKLPAAGRVDHNAVAELLKLAIHNGGMCLQQICRLPGAGKLSVDQLVTALHAAIETDSHKSIVELGRLPATAVISVQTLAQLLQAAARQGRSTCMWQLCMHPAVQHMDSTETVQALDAAVQRGCDACTEQLCRLPAAQRVSSDAVAVLLQAAVNRGSQACARQLRKLPAASHVTDSAVECHGREGVQHRVFGLFSGSSAAGLFTLPA